MGAGSALPVWSRVNSSKASSRVPKPPGRTMKPSDSFISMSLRVKKYFISTSLGSEAMKALAPCSNGSRMFTPNERPGPVLTGGHDAGAGPGDHHPPRLGQLAGGLAGLGVDGCVGLGARRAEDGHLGNVAVGGEDLEGVDHLPEGCIGDLEIEPVGGAAGQAHHGGEDLDQLVAVGPAVGPVKQGDYEPADLVVLARHL